MDSCFVIDLMAEVFEFSASTRNNRLKFCRVLTRSSNPKSQMLLY